MWQGSKFTIASIFKKSSETQNRRKKPKKESFSSSQFFYQRSFLNPDFSTGGWFYAGSSAVWSVAQLIGRLEKLVPSLLELHSQLKQ